MKKILSTFLIYTSLVFALVANASTAKAPDQVVRQTFDTVVGEIQANRDLYQNDSKALYAMLEEALVPSLNISFMMDLILGKELATKTPAAKRDMLVSEFKTLLLRTYASGILYATGDEKVVYEPLKLGSDAYRADVMVKLVTAEGGEFPIKLQMTTRESRWNKNDTGKWRAYNLEVAGQNIARLYRATFARTLKEQGVDGLIASLRSRNSA